MKDLRRNSCSAAQALVSEKHPTGKAREDLRSNCARRTSLFQRSTPREERVKDLRRNSCSAAQALVSEKSEVGSREAGGGRREAGGGRREAGGGRRLIMRWLRITRSQIKLFLEFFSTRWIVLLGSATTEAVCAAVRADA